MKCNACGAIMRQGDRYQGDETSPTHEGCLSGADPALTVDWTLDNGEADDAAATAEWEAQQAGE